MQSKGLFGKKYLDIQERVREIAPPDEEHVIVQVRACGVCGTDINFVRDWADQPMALGHEISAEVVEVGKNVTTVKPGDSVIVEDCTMCGVCENCKSGQPQFCRNMYNIEGQPGMGQYMSVRFNSLVRYEGIEHAVACLTEPLAVSLTSVLNAQIPLGGSVVVLGPGPLGLMSARVAKLYGAGYVAITGLPADNPRERARLDLAARFGCDDFFEVGKQDVEAEIKRRFPQGVDRVIVSSPPQSMTDALKIIKFGGIITFYGLALRRPEHDPDRHQRTDLPQDLADPDLRRTGHQFPGLAATAARRTGRRHATGQPPLRLRRRPRDHASDHRRNPTDHQSRHAAQPVGKS
jgi:threonine dehydrogenase-like Zn-dependent dehydrogenase